MQASIFYKTLKLLTPPGSLLLDPILGHLDPRRNLMLFI
jgi:hypothetical protein